MDPRTSDQAGIDAARVKRQHRSVVRGGCVGGVVGLIFGIVTAVAMIMHPPQGSLDANDLGAVIFAPFMMIVLGVLGGAGLVCAFLPVSFYQSGAGAKWLKLVGTTTIGAARFVSLLIGLIAVGACIGLIVCIMTGHV